MPNPSNNFKTALESLPISLYCLYLCFLQYICPARVSENITVGRLCQEQLSGSMNKCSVSLCTGLCNTLWKSEIYTMLNININMGRW